MIKILTFLSCLVILLFFQSCNSKTNAKLKSKSDEPIVRSKGKDAKMTSSKDIFCSLGATYLKTINLLDIQNELLRSSVLNQLDEEKKDDVVLMKESVKETYDYLEEVLQKFINEDFGQMSYFCAADFQAKNHDLNYWKDELYNIKSKLYIVRELFIQSLLKIKGEDKRQKLESMFTTKDIDVEQLKTFDFYAIVLQLKDWQINVLELETQSLTFLLERVDLSYDKFEVLNEVSSNTIRKGDYFESMIALGGYSSQARFNVAVNGVQVQMIEGKAHYKKKATEVGKKEYEVKIRIKNPLTGVIEVFTKKYYYTVVE